ncbi:MAG: hypothetical protein KDB22_01000 [Planctomycetales bacterium]|nr:hypothetical protein [Planctomycetales bacterium]
MKEQPKLCGCETCPRSVSGLNASRKPWMAWLAVLAIVLSMSPLSIEVVIAQNSDTATSDTASSDTATSETQLSSTQPTQVDQSWEIDLPSPGNAPLAVPDAAEFQSEVGDDSDFDVAGSAAEGAALPGKLGAPEAATFQSHAETPKQNQPADSVRTLSVNPSRKPLLPEDHPRWITEAPDFKSPIHRFVVASIPTIDPDGVDESLEEPMIAKLYEYVDEHVAHSPNASQLMRDKLTVGYIWKNLIDDSVGYTAELNTSEGPMLQKWVYVTVTQPQQEQLETWYNEALQRQRLKPLALGMLSLAGLVGLAHLVLRRQQVSPQPVTQAQPLTNKPRTGGSGKAALILACIFLVPGMFVAATTVFLVRSSSQRNSHAVRQAISDHAELGSLPEVPEIAMPQPQAASSSPEVFDLPLISDANDAELRMSPAETRIHSGNQVIIVRTKQ